MPVFGDASHHQRRAWMGSYRQAVGVARGLCSSCSSEKGMI